MIKISNLKCGLKFSDDELLQKAAISARVNKDEFKSLRIVKKSVDARKKDNIFYNVSVEAELSEKAEQKLLSKNPRDISEVKSYRYEPPLINNIPKRPVVVGFGPAGIFAALVLAEAGARPVIIERGKSVEERKRDVEGFWQKRILSEDSNVQFGEGGAGTFSDGKLNTGIKDFRIRKVLEVFAENGAPEEILYEARPHIGTDKLPLTVSNIRKKIIELGGEMHFSSKLSGVEIKDNNVTAVIADCGGTKQRFETDDVILAIGHSASDTFEMLDSLSIPMEEKAFSLGVRIEHRAETINFSQYGKMWKLLPTADYKLAVHLPNGRGVYTFCMCPGGSVVGAASQSERVVTNGMSNFARDAENSNSAVLVNVLPEDYSDGTVLSGLRFQESIENKAFTVAGSNYNAPVQRFDDFKLGKLSTQFGSVKPSYKPGVAPCDINELFPDYISSSLKVGITEMGKRLRGFDDGDAVLTAPETRSSSPIRIIRGEDFQSVGVKGMYPCGEGAGYAGGITSAAVDGMKCAEAVLNRYMKG